MGWKATRLKPQFRWWFLGTPPKMTSVISVTWGSKEGGREKGRKRDGEGKEKWRVGVS
jgi:hypothetical protein